jgi:ABC-type nitrate/sulfonate/bicarbonate transport system ATPase subunit
MSDLILDRISFWYRDSEPPVVYECNFRVPDRQFAAIVGESGGGKSTILRLACGLIQHQMNGLADRPGRMEGRVRFGDSEIREPRPEFAYVPQDFQAALIPSMTAHQNVLLAAGSDWRRREGRCARLLEATGIGDVAHLYPRQLSGGQRQRVAICRALLTEPKMLFMDEPFANLDPTLKPEMSSLLKSLRDDEQLRSLLLVTHDIENAADLADLVIGVRRGRFIPSASRSRSPNPALPEYMTWNRPDKEEIVEWIGN